mmetsp:Transcript_103336/g.262430  ORF Transcript_103336/g.262430 Transcript_103336/m.262430 type:complete len:152 (-) Transcript_103336:40-495(-)
MTLQFVESIATAAWHRFLAAAGGGIVNVCPACRGARPNTRGRGKSREGRDAARLPLVHRRVPPMVKSAGSGERRFAHDGAGGEGSLVRIADRTPSNLILGSMCLQGGRHNLQPLAKGGENGNMGATAGRDKVTTRNRSKAATNKNFGRAEA